MMAGLRGCVSAWLLPAVLLAAWPPVLRGACHCPKRAGDGGLAAHARTRGHRPMLLPRFTSLTPCEEAILLGAVESPAFGGDAEGPHADVVRILSAWEQRGAGAISGLLRAMSAAELCVLEKLVEGSCLELPGLCRALKAQIAAMPVCDYSNLDFIYMLFNRPSARFTAEALMARLTPIFLSSISTPQLLRLCKSILLGNLGLGRDGKRACLERIFNFINFTPSVLLRPSGVYDLVEKMLDSDVPDTFRLVYFTWKLWYPPPPDRVSTLLYRVDGTRVARELFMMLVFFLSWSPRVDASLRLAFAAKYQSLYLGAKGMPTDERLRAMLDAPRSFQMQIEAKVCFFTDDLVHLPGILATLSAQKLEELLACSRQMEIRTASRNDAYYHYLLARRCQDALPRRPCASAGVLRPAVLDRLGFGLDAIMRHFLHACEGEGRRAHHDAGTALLCLLVQHRDYDAPAMAHVLRTMAPHDFLLDCCLTVLLSAGPNALWRVHTEELMAVFAASPAPALYCACLHNQVSCKVLNRLSLRRWIDAIFRQHPRASYPLYHLRHSPRFYLYKDCLQHYAQAVLAAASSPQHVQQHVRDLFWSYGSGLRWLEDAVQAGSAEFPARGLLFSKRQARLLYSVCERELAVHKRGHCKLVKRF